MDWIGHKLSRQMPLVNWQRLQETVSYLSTCWQDIELYQHGSGGWIYKGRWVPCNSNIQNDKLIKFFENLLLCKTITITICTFYIWFIFAFIIMPYFLKPIILNQIILKLIDNFHFSFTFTCACPALKHCRRAAGQTKWPLLMTLFFPPSFSLSLSLSLSPKSQK